MIFIGVTNGPERVAALRDRAEGHRRKARGFLRGAKMALSSGKSYDAAGYVGRAAEEEQVAQELELEADEIEEVSATGTDEKAGFEDRDLNDLVSGFITAGGY